jgi:acetyl esterase/lipase
MRRFIEPYGEHPRQFGEWFIPEDGPARPPLVILVHGGYWRPVWRLDIEEASALDLAAHGFAVWSIEYRTYEHGWPTTMTDVATAIDQGMGEAARHGIDTSRRALLGHSAGGGLAAWATSRRSLPMDAPGADRDAPAFDLVVLHAPVACLALGSAEGLGDGAIDTLMGGRPEDVPERYAVTDPQALTPDPGSRRVLLHGDADADVPMSQSETYLDHLRDHGIEADLIRLAGDGHYEILDPTSSVSALRRDLLVGALTPGAQ